jgi:hypothetical protein
MGEGHDVGRRTLEKGDVDAAARAVERSVEARRRGAHHADFLANKVTSAVVRGRVAYDALEIGHAGNGGDQRDTAERGRHDDLLGVQCSGLLALFVDHNGPFCLVILLGFDDRRTSPDVEFKS